MEAVEQSLRSTRLECISEKFVANNTARYHPTVSQRGLLKRFHSLTSSFKKNTVLCFSTIFYTWVLLLSTASFTHVTWSWYLLILSCCHVSRFTVQSVQSCQRATFHCVHLWQRTESVVEIKIGKPAPNNEDACLEQLFFDDSIPIQTITGNLTHNSKVMMITVTVIMMSEFGWHSLCWAEFWTYFVTSL